MSAAAFTQTELGSSQLELGSDPPSGIRRRSELLAHRSSLTLLAECAQNSSGLRELERLVRELEPAVRRTCCGVLGRSHSDLDDAVQDCLLEIVRALPSYRFLGDFLHYANKISLRVALVTRRRSGLRRDRFHPLDACMAEPAAPTAPEADPARQVRRVLARLPTAQAEALSLHFVLGFSVAEAANLSNVSPNTVKTRIRLGKQRLLRSLRGPVAQRAR